MKKWLLSAGVLVALIFFTYRALQVPKPGAELERAPQQNVILISIDTVRTDYLQIYNPQGAPTPNLQKLADRGFLFTHAVSQVPFTLPSHCTMLTGTYPMKHLVQENVASKLSEDAVTLPEVLKLRGYQTAGFIGSLVLESGTGLEQGFDTYDDAFVRENRLFEDRSGIQKNAGAVKRSFLRWLDQRKANEPFFSFIHFYDPHAPYDPPAPFRPQVEEPKALYRGEIQYVDSVIGELMDDLSRRNLLNNSILVITGDHGEMLGEHGENGHGFFIYQEAVRVPLVFLVPGQKSGKSDNVVGLVDLMPTILNLLNVPIPQSIQGKSFAYSFRGEHSTSNVAYSESLTAAQHFGATPLRSIQDADYKYIDSARPELYDLRADSAEQTNLADTKKEIAVRMKAALDRILKSNSETMDRASERKLSPEKQEELAALGYIGGSKSIPLNSKVDAKDVLPSWNDLGTLSSLVKQPNCSECLAIVERIQRRGYLPAQARIFEARAYAGMGNPDRAISILQEVLKENPLNAQAEMVLAHSYVNAGTMDPALAIYKRMMNENSILGLEDYAKLMLRLNRKEELQQTIDQFVATKTLTDKHYPVLGEIYLLLQQPQRAREFLQKALETSPENPFIYIHLSALSDSEGKTAEAIQFLEQYRDKFQTADYLLQLGRLYGKIGNASKEYEIFREMVDSYPNDPRGYFFLGKVVLQEKGEMQEVIRLAQTGLSLNPDPEFRPFGYFLLGDAYTALGETAKAQSYLKKAEELEKEISGGTN